MIAEKTVMPRNEKPKRNDIAVKVDADVVRMARIIAAADGVSLAECLSETLRPQLAKRIDELKRQSFDSKRR